MQNVIDIENPLFLKDLKNEELKKEIIDSVDKENKLKQISKDLVVFVEKNEKAVQTAKRSDS